MHFPVVRFTLNDNGESNLARALAPMVQFMIMRFFPIDMLAHIISFLNAGQGKPHTHNAFLKQINDTQSKIFDINTNRTQTHQKQLVILDGLSQSLKTYNAESPHGKSDELMAITALLNCLDGTASIDSQRYHSALIKGVSGKLLIVS